MSGYDREQTRQVLRLMAGMLKPMSKSAMAKVVVGTGGSLDDVDKASELCEETAIDVMQILRMRGMLGANMDENEALLDEATALLNAPNGSNIPVLLMSALILLLRLTNLKDDYTEVADG
jgi:hypothetical protein